MATSPVVFEQIVQQVQQLPPDEQLRLITRVAGQLAGVVRARPSQRRGWAHKVEERLRKATVRSHARLAAAWL